MVLISGNLFSVVKKKERKKIFNFINYSQQRRNRGIIQMLFETIKRYQKRKFYMAEKI